jgi:hypothetical protein
MTEQHSPYPHADKAESDPADGDDKTDQDGLGLVRDQHCVASWLCSLGAGPGDLRFGVWFGLLSLDG